MWIDNRINMSYQNLLKNDYNNLIEEICNRITFNNSRPFIYGLLVDKRGTVNDITKPCLKL